MSSFRSIAVDPRWSEVERRAVQLGIGARVLPRYFSPLLDRLMLNADAIIPLDQMGIGTTAQHIVCEKPVA